MKNGRSIALCSRNDGIQIVLKVRVAVRCENTSIRRIVGIQTIGCFPAVRHAVLVRICRGSCGTQGRPRIDGTGEGSSMGIATLHIDQLSRPVLDIIHDPEIQRVAFETGTRLFQYQLICFQGTVRVNRGNRMLRCGLRQGGIRLCCPTHRNTQPVIGAYGTVSIDIIT